jgi:hypothetical protein
VAPEQSKGGDVFRLPVRACDPRLERKVAKLTPHLFGARLTADR